MIEFEQKVSGDSLHFPKVNQDPAFIEDLSPEDHFNFPIVPVEVFALPTEVPQIVGSGKISDDLHFIKGLIQTRPSWQVTSAWRDESRVCGAHPRHPMGLESSSSFGKHSRN
jgi:hypothetical protein